MQHHASLSQPPAVRQDASAAAQEKRLPRMFNMVMKMWGQLT
jgi:hypothetical protein